MPAVLAADMGIIAGIAVQREVVVAASGAIEFDDHSAGIRASDLVVQNGAGEAGGLGTLLEVAFILSTAVTAAATALIDLRFAAMPDDLWTLRDRARQCRDLAKTARDEPMRLMLERMAAELEEEARKLEASSDQWCAGGLRHTGSKRQHLRNEAVKLGVYLQPSSVRISEWAYTP